MLLAAKEKMLSPLVPWCAETCISAHESEGKKPHQGVAAKKSAHFLEHELSNSTTALGLRGQAALNRIGSRCTGKKRDTETGLDYFGARYYSNGLGRFTSPDWASKPSPVPYAELADPQSLNLYSYVRNIPTARFDKDGHKDCSGSGANCTQFSQIQIKQTVNLYEDSKNPNKITGTVQVTTTVTVIYGGGQQTSITAIATATNVGNTHYSAAQLARIGSTVAAVQAQGLTKSLGSEPARLLTATVGRESTFGITAPTNPLQLACSSGQCASPGDTAGNIDKAENILSDRVRSQHDNPARTYDRYNAGPNHVTNTQRFMNSYSTMQQGLAGTTYTGVPAPPLPEGLK